MNKNNIVIGLIILALIGGYYFSRQNNPFTSNQGPTETPIEKTLNLSEEWKKADNDKVELELNKTVTSGYKPQIVLTKSESKDATKPGTYVNNLVAGARSAIPSLKFTEDKRDSKENLYTAFLVGSYTNQKDKINLIQRVYIKGEIVFTLTGSFQGDLASEVNSILDSIANEKILK